MTNKYSQYLTNFIPKNVRLIGLIFCFNLLFCGIAGAQSKAFSAPPSEAREKLTAMQWREDLKIAAGKFLESDRSFSSAARTRFRQAIDNLQKTVDKKTDEQIIVELAKAVALAENAHTRLYILRNRSELRRYPIRVWWFADGLYVVAAMPEYRQLLGTKLTRIGGQTVEKVKRAVDPLFAGNASWREYMSAYTMTSPEILIGLGIVATNGNASVEFKNRSGKAERVLLAPLPLKRSNQPTESWWDLSPTRPRNDSFVNALALSDDRVPFYLRQNEKQYWSQFLPDEKLFYIQFNRAGDAPEGESFAKFGERVLAELQNINAAKIAVDLRFNTGGNLDVAAPFIKQLSDFAKNRGIKTYVMTGRATFSAGIFHAMQLRQWANAVLVGETVGDNLDFWAEGGNVTMPNSQLTLHFADRFHSYSPVERPEFKEYLFTSSDLSVRDAAPSILVKMTAAEYFAGRDPALEAIKRAR